VSMQSQDEYNTDKHNLFSFLADFKLKIGDMADTAKLAARNAKWAAQAATPHPYRIVNSGVVDANGNSLIFSQYSSGPDLGHFWQIRSIVIGGQHPNDTVTGRADVFASATDLVAASVLPGGNYLQALGLTDWRDTTATMPNIAFYGRGEFTVRAQEEITVVVTGGTPGQTIACSVQVEDYQESTQNQGGF
jgi:hypothetical protein